MAGERIRVNIPGLDAPVLFPADYTPEQIKFVIENDILPRLNPIEKPPAMARLGRGIADVTEGVAQGALTIKDLFTGGNEREAYTREKDADIATYERGRGKDAGIDWLRLGGNVAATLPAMAIPGAGSASLPIRMLAGAGQGAAASGAMFTPEGQSTAGNMALGGLIGGAVPAVVQGAKSAGGAVLDRVMPPPPARQNPQMFQGLAGEISIKLEQHGIDFSKLTRDVQKSLIDDAERALKTGASMDAAMLSNKALIESVGAKPTRASVTRAPRDWQTEKNLRGIPGVGDGIVQREQSNAAALTDFLGRQRAATGGNAVTRSDAGESAITALKSTDAIDKLRVDAAYKGARDNVGRAAPMDSASFSKAANLGLDEEMLGAYLPAEVRSILNDITIGKIPFNVNTMVQIDSVLSQAQRSAGNSPQALAIGKVRDALNAAPIESTVGEDAKAAFAAARGLARNRFQKIEGAPALAAALDDVAPDKFVQKFILNADVRDVRAMMAELLKSPEGAQAIKDIKGNILGDLMMKATGSTLLEDVAGKPFSGVRFSNALDSISPEKLHAMFSPDEIGALRALQKASKLLTEEVPFSDVNHSKTAAALANLLQKVGNTPLLGKLVSPIIGIGKIGLDWVKNANDRTAVAEALLGSAVNVGKKPLSLPPPGVLGRVLPGAAGAATNDPSQRTNQ